MAIPVFNLSSLDGTNGFRMDGEAEDDRLGSSISSAGDINGDGFDDVIIGAPSANESAYYSPSGTSYVVFGKAFGFDPTLNLTSLDGSNGFRMDGFEYGMLGLSVSNAGDVNGDGLDDLIIGAPFTDSNGGRYGTAYVVFGKDSGFGARLSLSLNGSNGFYLPGLFSYHYVGLSVSSAGDVNGDGFDDVIIDSSYYSSVVFGKAGGFDARMEVSNLDGNNGFRLIGKGTEVSGAGDVNGDGLDDVIVGEWRADPNGTRSGSSYVVFGKVSGFDAELSLSSLDGNNGFRMDGVAAGDYLGRSVSNAGDINGDGFDDLIVGAPGADPIRERSGSSYVVFGKDSGFDAAVNLSTLDGNNGFRLDGTAEFNFSGDSVSNAGDVNGDGFDDLIVGAPGADPNGMYSGSSYVVFGRASSFSAAINLSSLDSTDGVRLDGVAGGDYSGRSVSSAGDVNGDGFDDLIVGAPGADPNGIYSGSSYVIFGRSDFGGGGNVIAGTPGDDVLKGTSGADIFEAGDGNDLMVGRGGADVFKAGAGNDKITVTDLDFASVAGGAGNDVLHLAGNGLNLDVADFGANISGIETFCLFGQGDNTLTLTAADLLNLSDTSDTLKVNGNAAGHIIVEDSGWTDEGPRGSGYYHVYTNDEAVLLVGQNITVDFA